MAQKSIICRSNVFKILDEVVFEFEIDKLTIKSQKTREEIIIIDKNLGGAYIKPPSNITDGITYLSILYFKDKVTDGLTLKKIHIFDVFCQTNTQVQEIVKLVNLIASATQIKVGKSIEDVLDSTLKNLLVIINPSSGMAQGEKIYTEYILPYLKYMNSNISKLVSESKEHLIEFGKKIRKSDYDLVIVIGGDGTLHYIINGMYQDFFESGDLSSVDKPFVMVPSGSGNGLIGSVFSHSKLSPGIDNSIYLCFKGGSIGFTLSKVNVQYQNNLGITDNRQMLSFLNLTWGGIADIDIESYKYKSLGEQRYVISGIKNVLFRKKRKAKIYYRPYGKREQSMQIAENNQTILDGPEGGCYLTVLLSHVRNVTSTVTVSEDISVGFPGFALLIMRGHASAFNLLKLITSNNFQTVCESIKSKKSTEKPLWLELINIEGLIMEAEGGRLVIDGELICKGKFTCELEILPFKFQHLSII